MSRLISLVLATLLAAFLVGAPAQAGPRPPGPEVVEHAAPAPGRSSAKALPATVDSDVYVYALTPKGQPFFVVAGHLKLGLRSGSSTAYKGSFVDYTGQKSYQASADASDPTAPVLTLGSKNGKFTVRSNQYFGSTSYSGTVLTKPAKLKVSPAKIVFSGAAHSVASATYSIVLSERSGRIENPIEYVGTLTIAYDIHSRISGGQITVTNSKGKNVTHALKSSGFYSTSSFYTVVQVDKRYFGVSATVSGTTFSGFAFGADGSKTTEWAISGNA